jgi:hypothetical protein
MVGHAVGLKGSTCPPGLVPDDVEPDDFAIFASILPEGEYDLVKAFQPPASSRSALGDTLINLNVRLIDSIFSWVTEIIAICVLQKHQPSSTIIADPICTDASHNGGSSANL